MALRRGRVPYFVRLLEIFVIRHLSLGASRLRCGRCSPYVNIRFSSGRHSRGGSDVSISSRRQSSDGNGTHTSIYLTCCARTSTILRRSNSFTLLAGNFIYVSRRTRNFQNRICRQFAPLLYNDYPDKRSACGHCRLIHEIETGVLAAAGAKKKNRGNTS